MMRTPLPLVPASTSGMFLRASALMILFFMVGCGGADSSAPQPGQVVGKVLIRTSAIDTTARVVPSDTGVIGATIQLYAIAVNASGGVLSEKTATWSSSAPGVASVSLTGVVTSKGFGQTTITATVEGVAGFETIVFVAPPPAATKYVVTASSLITLAGASVTITAQLADASNNPVSTSGKTVTWSKSGNGGSLSAPTSSTNSSGVASVVLTTSTTIGTTHSVIATDNTSVTGTVAVVAAGFSRLTAGLVQTCALISSGAAYCWGLNTAGELGDGTTTSRMSPVAVTGGLTFGSLVAGYHTCGLTGNGTAYCWGDNSYGELGDGTKTDQSSPVAVVGGLLFATLTASGSHTCGLTGSGAAYCWGVNSGSYDAGALGDGTTTDQSSPRAVTGGLTFTSLTSGFHHTCGLTANGTAYCWGDNTLGNLATERRPVGRRRWPSQVV